MVTMIKGVDCRLVKCVFGCCQNRKSGSWEPWSKLPNVGFYRDHIRSFSKELLGGIKGVLTIARLK